MKFGRTIKEERNAEWSPYYLDYAMLKKVTKLDEETVATTFLELLKAQRRKVQQFMRAHLEAYQEEVCTIELLPAQGSERLVQDIEAFQKFAWLNNLAVRKAVKRLLKRFPSISSSDLELSLDLSYLGSTQCGISQDDIEAWLHAPALQFLGLSKAQGRATQLDFWIQELKVGLRMALVRICANEPANPTSIRLSIRDEEEEEADAHLCVKNTFIQCGARERGSAARRTCSAPPRVSCRDSCASGAPRGACNSDKSTADDSGSTQSRSSSGSPRELPERPQQPPPAPRHKEVCKRPGRQNNRQGSQVDPTGSRWWMASEATCPITGFPVKLLPYPPIKLTEIGNNLSRRKSTHLVDGLFLSIQAIATWRFEVFGRPLTSAEIVALDSHVKRCKLGPYRISHALRLASSVTEQDRCELQALISKAQRRLSVLKHVQSVRSA